MLNSPNEYFCLPDNSTELKNIVGVFGSNKFVSWFIEAIICDPTTNQRCNSKERLIQTYPSFYMPFIMNNVLIKPNNYNNPIHNYFSGRLLYLSSQFFRKDTYIMQLYEMLSDSGLILSSVIS